MSYSPKMQVEEYVTFDLDATELGEKIGAANSDFQAVFLDNMGMELKHPVEYNGLLQLSHIAGDLTGDGKWLVKELAKAIAEEEKDN